MKCINYGNNKSTPKQHMQSGGDCYVKNLNLHFYLLGSYCDFHESKFVLLYSTCSMSPAKHHSSIRKHLQKLECQNATVCSSTYESTYVSSFVHTVVFIFLNFKYQIDNYRTRSAI